MKSIDFTDKVHAECWRQVVLWGEGKKSCQEEWLAILCEEVREVSDALREGDNQAALTELIQCAAVIQSWVTTEF